MERLDVAPVGVAGDRRWAVLDVGTGRVLSAKRTAALLGASADDSGIRLPDGPDRSFEDPDLDAVLSEWLGRQVRLANSDESASLSYEMTFDPPDDSAEYYEIPIPDGTFLDLAPIHLLATATLAGCRAARPDLDWDVRRFRPNLVLDVPGDTFIEDSWSGRRLRLGPECVVSVDQPTVRCAMPLRAQPAGVADDSPVLDRQPELFAAMGELHDAAPNHLGAYASVVSPGTVRIGDTVELLDD